MTTATGSWQFMTEEDYEACLNAAHGAQVGTVWNSERDWGRAFHDEAERRGYTVSNGPCNCHDRGEQGHEPRCGYMKFE